MKNIVTCFLMAATLVSGVSFAHGNKACKEVWDACKAAGHKGKDGKNCMKTLKSGGTVEGVTVDATTLAACQGKAAPAAAEAPAPTAAPEAAPAPTAN